MPSGTAGGSAGHTDGRTRQAVTKLLLERGPVTAALIADALGLSPAAVRRHLDALVADGEVGTREAPRRGRRGRGRPAKLFLLTEAGRARFGHA
ncbi:MAG TPA: helix-turn-helix domain-containing protein, partial [Pseudonocardiaceae bacterium]|nr:helix-turn-helix domain-containing protein [Pseudonocardiaceae bacterium]